MSHDVSEQHKFCRSPELKLLKRKRLVDSAIESFLSHFQRIANGIIFTHDFFVIFTTVHNNVQVCHFPTDSFTNLELQNMSLGVPELNRIGRSLDFKALKL